MFRVRQSGASQERLPDDSPISNNADTLSNYSTIRHDFDTETAEAYLFDYEYWTQGVGVCGWGGEGFGECVCRLSGENSLVGSRITHGTAGSSVTGNKQKSDII